MTNISRASLEWQATLGKAASMLRAPCQSVAADTWESGWTLEEVFFRAQCGSVASSDKGHPPQTSKSIPVSAM